MNDKGVTMIKVGDFSKDNLEKVFDTSFGDPVQTRTKELEWLMDRCMDDDNALFVELGVYIGTTINTCAGKKKNRTFNGFDSFEGLPEEWNFRKDKIYPAGKSDYKSFWLPKLPDVKDNVILHKGWFNETLPEFVKTLSDNQYISFLHLDADLYSSTYEGLSTLNNYIVKGTILKFDEFCTWYGIFDDCHNTLRYDGWEDGEYKALNDWMKKFDRKVKPYSRDSKEAATVIVTQ